MLLQMSGVIRSTLALSTPFVLILSNENSTTLIDFKGEDQKLK